MAGIEDYLKNLKEQTVQEKKIKIIRDPCLDDVFKLYETWMARQRLETTRSTFKIASEWLKILSVSSKLVKDFSIDLKRYEEQGDFYASGVFLSALINRCREKNVEIKTEHLSRDLEMLGRSSKKIIKVIGNVGFNAGYRLEGGELHIEGNALNGVGLEMKRGKIFVRGNAGTNAGAQMTGGEIMIEGDSENSTGYFMHAGKIHVKGNASGRLGNSARGGQIYVDGNAGIVGLGATDIEIHVGGEMESIGENHGIKVYNKNKLIHNSQEEK